jgi:hypothetical protein
MRLFYAFASHEKVRDVFEIKDAPIDLTDAIRRMTEWAKAYGAMKPSLFGSIEVEKNLPPSWKISQ